MNLEQIEFDILTLLSNGSNAQEIGKALNISEENVRDCLAELLARILATGNKKIL